MATVQLSDVYEPTTFNQLMQEKSTRKDAFVQSGVLITSTELDDMASQGGRFGEMPAYSPIGKTEPNYSTDDNTSFSTPQGLSSTEQVWRLAVMNQSWSTMDFARDLALADPLDAITNSVDEYWTYVRQSRLISSCLGILADNVANDSGDMVYDISLDTADAITAAELVSAEAIIAAAATMGDRQNEFTAIAMHSTIYTRLKNLNLIDYVEASDAKTRFAYYQEMLVIVDDGMPAVAGTNRIIYTTILFKAGVFGLGRGRVAVPSEYDRIASSGDGGGEEVLHSRESYIIHPWGGSFLSASVAGKTPTFAELEAAANWDRVFDRKNLGIAFLKTNG